MFIFSKPVALISRRIHGCHTCARLVQNVSLLARVSAYGRVYILLPLNYICFLFVVCFFLPFKEYSYHLDFSTCMAYEVQVSHIV